MEEKVKQAVCNIWLPEYAGSLLSDLHSLQQQGTMCDVKLQTNDGEILAHMLVLVAASPYFKESLLSTKTEEGVVTLYIEDTDLATLQYMVTFFYGGRVPVPTHALDPFVTLCDQLMMPKLAELCLNLIAGGAENKAEGEAASGDIVYKTEAGDSQELAEITTVRHSARKRKLQDAEALTDYDTEEEQGSTETIPPNVTPLSSSRGRKKKSCSKVEKVKSKVGRKPRLANDSTGVINSAVKTRKSSGKTVNRKSGKYKSAVALNFRNSKSSTKTSINNFKDFKGPTPKIKAFKKPSVASSDIDAEKDTDEDSVAEELSDNVKSDEVQIDGPKKQLVRTNVKPGFPKECNVCNEVVKTVKAYTEHMKTHKRAGLKAPRRVRAGGYPCCVCGRMLTSAVRQACHQNSKHGVPYDPQFKLHTCTHEGCNYTTASKHYLQIHTRGRHSNERPHVCEFCGKGFKLPSALITHLNIHTKARKYSCQHCQLTFNQKGGLDIHIKKHHQGQESWSELCHLCSEKFLHKAELCWHMYQAHQIPVPDRYHVFSCELCDYQTIRKNKLERHMDAHGDKRTFVCNICGKKFVTKSYLNRHVTYHGEKRFKCDFEGCSYACVDSLGLKKHIRLMHTHKNYKPFLCSICPYKTGLRGNLDKHIRTVHGLEVVTKHTVHLRMKFRGHTSGDILTKDGKLVQRVMDTRHPTGLHGLDEEEDSGSSGINEKQEPGAADLHHHGNKHPNPDTSPTQAASPEGLLRTSREGIVGTSPPASTPSQLQPRDFTPGFILPPASYNIGAQLPTSVPGEARMPLPAHAQPQSDMYLSIDPMSFKYSEFY